VYQPECEVQVKAPEPAASPGAPPVEVVCPPTVVTLKVINRVTYRTGGDAGT
jgi:hypothetical protein